jgi:hypothetical protein
VGAGESIAGRPSFGKDAAGELYLMSFESKVFSVTGACFGVHDHAKQPKLSSFGDQQ